MKTTKLHSTHLKAVHTFCTKGMGNPCDYVHFDPERRLIFAFGRVGFVCKSFPKDFEFPLADEHRGQIFSCSLHGVKLGGNDWCVIQPDGKSMLIYKARKSQPQEVEIHGRWQTPDKLAGYLEECERRMTTAKPAARVDLGFGTLSLLNELAKIYKGWGIEMHPQEGQMYFRGDVYDGDFYGIVLAVIINDH